LILEDAIEDAGFKPNMVSDADDVGVIHRRIVQNIYENPIVVCDVSGRNANVMFELGMRLAFDRPAIIVKDDKSPYSFDTGLIEHIPYPRDLRFAQIIEFKKLLSEKIQATYSKSSDPNYTTFLKHFPTITVSKPEAKVVSPDEFILSELKNLSAEFAAFRSAVTPRYYSPILQNVREAIRSSYFPTAVLNFPPGLSRAELNVSFPPDWNIVSAPRSNGLYFYGPDVKMVIEAVHKELPNAIFVESGEPTVIHLVSI